MRRTAATKERTEHTRTYIAQAFLSQEIRGVLHEAHTRASASVIKTPPRRVRFRRGPTSRIGSLVLRGGDSCGRHRQQLREVRLSDTP